METLLTYRGLDVTSHDAAFTRDLIAAHPRLSRRKLSVELCHAWNWYQANGATRDMVCRSMMLALHRAGHIELPPVRRTDDEPILKGLIEEHHYLGYTQPVGEQLKHMVFAGDRPVACFTWSSAPRHLGARDRFIGWAPDVRRANIRFVAYNSRFLILPWVKVPHLASHVLSRVTRRLSADLEAAYNHPVHFAETFIHTERFKGTCYKAANWIYMGRTTGRGKDDQTKRVNRPIKDILGLPLTKRFAEKLLSA